MAVRSPAERSEWLWATLALSLPLLAFGFLWATPRWDLVLQSGTWHFVIVSTVALLALGLAIVVASAARHLPDARTFFLAMGFLSMAGIFLAHGAGTAPFFGGGQMAGMCMDAGSCGAAARDHAQQVKGYAASAYDGDAASIAPAQSAIVGFSARLSLLVSALCFALAVVDLRRRIADSVVRLWTLFAVLGGVLLAGYVVVALAFPSVLAALPLDSVAVSWGVALLVWAALALAGWRFLQAYWLSALPLQGTMALAMALLGEAQLFMILSPTWHLSWWEYHVVMLAGFLYPVLALLRQYRHAADLGAIVEGLFLRQALGGLRSGDPLALTALGAAVAARDGETGAHLERVAAYSVGIGEQLGLAGEQLEILRWAGRLHDLGKIGVPTSILHKPGRLSDSEFSVMQGHSDRGWRVASRSGLLVRAAPAIRAHHERWNGSGYPDGLAGEAIPLEARIVSVADVWDALTTDRPYRAALSSEDARAILVRDAGVLLDPDCVRAFFAVLNATDATREEPRPSRRPEPPSPSGGHDDADGAGHDENRCRRLGDDLTVGLDGQGDLGSQLDLACPAEEHCWMVEVATEEGAGHVLREVPPAGARVEADVEEAVIGAGLGRDRDHATVGAGVAGNEHQ